MGCTEKGDAEGGSEDATLVKKCGEFPALPNVA